MYKKIIEIMNRINSSMNLQSLLATIMDSAQELLNAEGASLLLLDRGKDRLIFDVVISEKGEIIKGNTLEIGQGIAGTVAASGQSIISNDAPSDPRFSAAIDKASGFVTRNIMAVPVRNKEDLIGVLEVVNSRTGSFQEKELGMLTYVADAAAVAINNHELLTSLKNRVAELTCIYDISQSIYFTFNIEDFLARILQAVNKIIRAGRCSFVILDETGRGAKYFVSTDGVRRELPDLEKTMMWHVIQSGDPMLVYDIDTDQKCCTMKRGDARYSSKSFLCVPMKLLDRIIGVLNVTDKPGDEVFDSFDLRVLSTIASHVAETYENVVLQKMNYEKQLIDQELSIAAEIQAQSVSRLPHSIPGASVGGFTIPSRIVGGDFLEFIVFDDSFFGGSVGDVSGKGVPAALFMNVVRNALRFEAERHRDPEAIITAVNRWVCRESHSGMFCTFFYFLADQRNRLIRYASAGHNIQLFYDSDRDEFVHLKERGKPLGISESEQYEVGVVRCDPGDFLVLFTDGVVDESAQRGMSMEELMGFIRQGRSDDAPLVASRIRDAVDRATGSMSLQDDSTMLLVRFH
ncbi:MAG: SpoIIE family protein phosphatase [Spirochaetes bacterium]|nr:SpoIIE family protein phosphatase [Spirochaetota bacterium]